MSEEVNLEYKGYYSKIFAFFYFIQGFVQGIPGLVLAPYVANILGNQYDIAQFLIVAFLGYLPWTIKMIIGIINDKWGSKRFGRRFPFIAGFGIFGGIWWIIMALYLPTNDSIYTYLALYVFMIMIGMAFADTALDGLILDVTPKKRLGKVQGFTWACMLLGVVVGGAFLGLLFMILNMIPILFIITGILMMVSCILPYFIEELPVEKIKKMGHEILSIFTRRKNYKVMIFTFTASITGGIIVRFFSLVILISMGIIDVDETILSITKGSAVDLLGWTSVFYFFNGMGTIIGSIIAGKFIDKNRKKSITIAYLTYIPFCLVSVIPFILIGDYLVAMIFGFIGLVVFGTIQAALLIASATIRADIVKNEYPNLKSTYYALLISCWNGGLALGTLLGAFLIIIFSSYFTDFNTLYFLVSVFCAGVLMVSLLCFNLIDQKDYELEHIVGEENEVYFA